jgi:dipeptidyl aminopeptidase/acylaminoacyl peptidase
MAAFNAARIRNIPAEMVLFPEENHWILKPQNNIFWHRTFYAWLDAQLKVEN